MKLGHPLDEIKYVGTKDTVAEYEVALEGRRVMLVWCDQAAAESKREIWIARPDGSNAQPTKGVFRMYAPVSLDADGVPTGVGASVADYRSVYTYVVPRIAVLLARLYVPATPSA